jgi:hypothetical protein
LREISKEIVLTEEEGMALFELQEKYEASGMARPDMYHVPEEEAEKMMKNRKWEPPKF